MATGVSLSRTLEGGHEPLYDFPCSLCEKVGKHMEALRYCEECLVYMCDSCVNYHNRFPLNSRHKLLDQSQFTTLNQPALKSFPTKRCLKHPGELINIFCEDHDAVCCSVCKALEHSKCTQTKHLPDAAKGVQLSQEYQDTKKETKAFLSKVKKVLSNQRADISRIAKEKEHVKQTIANFRMNVNKYFDTLEQKSLDELDVREKSITTIIDQDVKYLDTTKTKAEEILKEMEAFKGENECELFVQIITGKHLVHAGLSNIEGISETVRKESIQFIINPDIETYLKSLQIIGSFTDTDTTLLRPRTASTDSQIVNLQPFHFSETKYVNQSNTDEYQARLFERFNIVEDSDTQVCRIGDIYQLLDGNILVADVNNDKLKRLDKSYELLDSVQLTSGPGGICSVGSNEVAVSVSSEKIIQFVSVAKKLTLTRSFCTSCYCRGMVYVDGKLYVCCGDTTDTSSGRIEVFDKSGERQYFIPRASIPLRISVSDRSQHLLVTSYESDDVMMVDYTGNVVNTFNTKELRAPRGICTDGRGHVFVCGRDSNTIVQFSLKYKKMKVLVKKTYSTNMPYGICFDRKRSRLLVCCDKSNELLAFVLK